MRKALVPIVVALLSILALGLVAATLPSMSGADGEGLSPPGESDSQSDGAGGSNPEVGESVDQRQPLLQEDNSECVGGFDSTDVTWMILILSVSLSFLVFLRTRSFLPMVVAFTILFLSLTFLSVIVFGMLGCDWVPPGAPLGGGEGGGGGVPAGDGNVSEGQGDVEEEPASLPTRLKLLGVLSILVVLSAVLGLYIYRRRKDDSAPPEPGRVPDELQGEIGAAAGDAADELEEDAELENAVYEAWAEMASTLSVDDPETSTPAEFARAARAAGIRQADVDELTALFEEVRYGTAEVTPRREQRAIDALRRIERHYADESGGQSEGAL